MKARERERESTNDGEKKERIPIMRVSSLCGIPFYSHSHPCPFVIMGLYDIIASLFPLPFSILVNYLTRGYLLNTPRNTRSPRFNCEIGSLFEMCYAGALPMYEMSVALSFWDSTFQQKIEVQKTIDTVGKELEKWTKNHHIPKAGITNPVPLLNSFITKHPAYITMVITRYKELKCTHGSGRLPAGVFHTYAGPRSSNNRLRGTGNRFDGCPDADEPNWEDFIVGIFWHCVIYRMG
jgi:hypothetical protein